MGRYGKKLEMTSSLVCRVFHDDVDGFQEYIGRRGVQARHPGGEADRRNVQIFSELGAAAQDLRGPAERARAYDGIHAFTLAPRADE